MLSRTFRLLRTSPVTWLLLFGCPLLWVFDVMLSHQLGIPYEAASRLLGAEDQISMWNGEWWRVITTAFHHGGIVHLLMNLSLIGVIGRALEFRLGSFCYFIFCSTAIVVSGTAQSFWEPYVGLSGLGFAQFGLIWIWRRRDRWWRDQVPDQVIQYGFVWFLGCFVIDRLGIMPIGNVAHAAGLGYGCLFAVTRYGGARARSWWPIFISTHAFLIPGLYFVTHPVWNGKYHWHCGDIATNSTDKIRHFKNAIRQDPDLTGPWINLAIIFSRENEMLEAWRYIIQGLSRHPTSEEMIQVAREVGRNLIGPHQRTLARQFLDQTFGEYASKWEGKLLSNVPLEDLPQLKLEELSRFATPDDAAEKNIDEPQLPELPTTLPRHALDEIPRPGQKLPAPNPDAPGSAEEGRAA